jgi:DNA-binding NarL/FixJ family response regulator
LDGEAISLTKRQLDVLHHLAEGRSTDEIATALAVSRATARNHIANLLTAMGAHSRLQAVVIARRVGILSD